MVRITKELIQSYYEYLCDEEKASATKEKYLHDISEFVKWGCERCLDKSLVLEYKEYLIEKFAPASVNSIISSLNGFFIFNGWYFLKVKALKIQRKIFTSQEKELSKEEYERLLSAAQSRNNLRLYYLMQTICSTGIRVSELRFITVDAVMRGQATINMKGKMRVVILPYKLCEVLKKYIRKNGIISGSVFVSKSGKPLDRTNIWADMKALCNEAKVSPSKVFPHNLRHLFARTYYSIQKDIVRLADILGHSSMDTTRIYTIETGDIHRKQIQKLGLLLC